MRLPISIGSIRSALHRFRHVAGFLLRPTPIPLEFGAFLLDHIADVGVLPSRNLKPWNYFRSIPISNLYDHGS